MKLRLDSFVLYEIFHKELFEPLLYFKRDLQNFYHKSIDPVYSKVHTKQMEIEELILNEISGFQLYKDNPEYVKQHKEQLKDWYCNFMEEFESYPEDILLKFLLTLNYHNWHKLPTNYIQVCTDYIIDPDFYYPDSNYEKHLILKNYLRTLNIEKFKLVTDNKNFTFYSVHTDELNKLDKIDYLNISPEFLIDQWYK